MRSGRGRGAVVEEDDAVGEGFGGEEFEADGAMARLNEGDAFADEDGDDVDAELIDFAQEGGEERRGSVRREPDRKQRGRPATALLRLRFAEGANRRRMDEESAMKIPDLVLEKLRELPPEKQRAVLEFVESLQQNGAPTKPLKGFEGLLEEYNVQITEEDIAEARREMWGNFPRDVS